MLCVYLAFTPELANLAIRPYMSVLSSVYGTSVDPQEIVLQCFNPTHKND